MVQFQFSVQGGLIVTPSGQRNHHSVNQFAFDGQRPALGQNLDQINTQVFCDLVFGRLGCFALGYHLGHGEGVGPVATVHRFDDDVEIQRQMLTQIDRLKAGSAAGADLYYIPT